MITREDVIASLIMRGRPAMHWFWTGDSCIAAVRIARDVLKSYGFDARVLRVEAIVGNARYTEMSVSGASVEDIMADRMAWSVGVGHKKEDGQQGLHLVVLSGPYIVDLSLDQASRPQRDMIIRPTAVKFERTSDREKFLAGQQMSWLAGGSSVLSYQVVPDDQSWQDSPNWGDRDATPRDVVVQLVRSVIAEREASSAS